jgi:hypothetical protein
MVAGPSDIPDASATCPAASARVWPGCASIGHTDWPSATGSEPFGSIMSALPSALLKASTPGSALAGPAVTRLPAMPAAVAAMAMAVPNVLFMIPAS